MRIQYHTISLVYIFILFVYTGIKELTAEDFQSYESPIKAFYKLSSKMEKFFSQVEFSKVHRACRQHTLSPGGGQFTKEFTNAIFVSQDLNGLLDVLTNSEYWNWLDVRIMEAMAIYSDNPAAERTLTNYKEYVSAFKLKDVLPEIPVHIDPISEYVTIEEKFNRDDIKGLTVGDIFKHRYTFSYEICDINPNIPKLCSITTGCLQLLWSIPRECGPHVYISALANAHKFENFCILYLKIEYYPTIYSSLYSHTSVTLPGTYIHVYI